jgi:hypothetical protein
MIIFIYFFFKELIIVEMSEISLNKFEKEGRVIELHKEGKLSVISQKMFICLLHLYLN